MVAAAVLPVVPEVKVALEVPSEVAYAVGSADEELLDTEIAEPLQALSEPDIVSEVARKEEEDLGRD